MVISVDLKPSEHQSEPLSDVVTKLLRGSFQVAMRRIGQLNRMTETGALDAGTCLEAIVGEAQGCARDARSTLESITGAGDERSIFELIASQNQILEAFSRTIQAQAERQALVATRMLETSSQIASLDNEIGAVSLHARLSSLGAGVEAAGMAPDGEAFAALAAQVQVLKEEALAQTQAVGRLVNILSLALPSATQAAHDMKCASDAFVTEIGGSISAVDQRAKCLGLSIQQTLASCEGCIARILTHSQNALSSLQFQDPVAQGLIAIAKDFNHASQVAQELVRVSSLANGLVFLPAVTATVNHRLARTEEIQHVSVVANNSNTPPAGKVLLF